MKEAQKEPSLAEQAQAARLGIRSALVKTRSGAATATVPVPVLGKALVALSGVEKLQARLDTQQKELAETRSKVTSLLEDFASDALPSEIEWCRLKCVEFDIAWPIKPIPYKGDLPTEAAAPASLAIAGTALGVAGSAIVLDTYTANSAAPCQRDCQTCEKKAEAVPSYEDLVQQEAAGGCLFLLRGDWDRLTDEGKRKFMKAAGGAGVGLQGEGVEGE